MLREAKNYFTITKKEWNGMLVLAIICFIILIAPDVYQLFKAEEHADFSRIAAASKILNEAKKNEPVTDHQNYYAEFKRADASFTGKKLKPQYFKFDPNRLSEVDWQKLGLSARQISVIKNYEAKGGMFFKKEDLKKIYSITPGDYERLAAYITIPEHGFKNKYSEDKPVFKPKPTLVVNVNEADSAGLTAIKGIGPAFAIRILKYRSRLGGFYRKDQLMEVYGLDSAKYAEIEKQIEVNPSAIIKIKINNCSFEDLKRNPYLSFKQMNAIIQYRKQHGDYKSVQDLQHIMILNAAIISKIEPYLEF